MIILAIAPVACGLLIGYVRGGRLRRLAGLRIRAVLILWAIAAVQLVSFTQPRLSSAIETWLGVKLLVPIFGLAGLWVLLNIPRRSRAITIALLLILLGGGMNATAIALNGKMPYSAVASEQPGNSTEESSPKHMPLNAVTRMVWLGDVIPVPPLQAALSAGDLILFVGMGLFVAAAMRNDYLGTSVRPTVYHKQEDNHGQRTSERTEEFQQPYVSPVRRLRPVGQNDCRHRGPNRPSPK